MLRNAGASTAWNALKPDAFGGAAQPDAEVFSDAEFWAIAIQLFNGDLPRTESTVRTWARNLIARKATQRGWRRDAWWTQTLTVERASATGDLGSL